jgi:5-hydroxyisourate hydrolase-like protein (transthyretin family)
MSTAEASLSGVVTDSSTGDPLSGISVAIFNDSTNQKLSAKTDSSGAYSIQSIPVGTYNIEVEGDDYSPTDKDDVSLPAGNTEMDFKMSKSGSIPGMPTPVKFRITGTVVCEGLSETDAGQTIVLKPTTTVSGVTVTAKNLNTGAVLGTTTSDSNGNFSIEIPLVSNEVVVPEQYSIVNEAPAVVRPIDGQRGRLVSPRASNTPAHQTGDASGRTAQRRVSNTRLFFAFSHMCGQVQTEVR